MAIEINGDTGISGVNGSATTPAIQGTDTNTGLSFGTDEVNVVTGGTTRATVDSSGRLLVGTSTARNIQTHDAKFQTEGVGYNNSTIQVIGNDNSVNGAYLFIGKTRGTALGSNTVVQNGDDLGEIRFYGADGTGMIPGARIQAQVDGTPGSNVMPGRLVFSTTADGASSPTERMRINKEGVLRFGQTTTNTPCQSATAGISFAPQGNVNAWRDGGSAGTFGRAQDGVVVQWYRGGSQVGTVTVASGSTSYNTSSDYRLKENVVPLTGAADRLNQLQVRRFNFIADPDTTVDGFIAHEAQAVVPEAVTGTQDEVEVWKEGEELPDGVSVGDNKLDEDGNTIPVYQGIDQSKFVPLLTAALQEALAKIETLETRLTALEGGTN